MPAWKPVSTPMSAPKIRFSCRHRSECRLESSLKTHLCRRCVCVQKVCASERQRLDRTTKVSHFPRFWVVARPQGVAWHNLAFWTWWGTFLRSTNWTFARSESPHIIQHIQLYPLGSGGYTLLLLRMRWIRRQEMSKPRHRYGGWRERLCQAGGQTCRASSSSESL